MFLSRKRYPRNRSIILKLLACILLTLTIYNVTDYETIQNFLSHEPSYAKYFKDVDYNLGKDGRAAKLTDPKDIAKHNETFKSNSFNAVLSNKIPLNRTIPDNRPSECLSVLYDNDLPTASVIIIYNNEAISAILRLIWSLINRTPAKYLHEIILYDDVSDKEELGKPLKDYVRDNFPAHLVKMYRSRERLGLIKAKVAGARLAQGQVLVFLDAHCEVNVGWAEPLLQRIKDKPNVVLCPMIDSINDETLEFSHSFGASVGGFTWSLHFTWIPVSQRVKNKRTSAIDPYESATMAGGLFALSKAYFQQIGYYDEGMEIWGGENLELSFRVWQCHGSLEFIPCSHVGHIFRATHPFEWPADKQDTHGLNSLRMARVWMDDYIRLYYAYRTDLKNKEVGDLTERKAIRQRLKCHDFKWFLDNVYPEKFIPDENVLAYGKVKNEATGLCWDMLGRDLKVNQHIGLFWCQGASSQEMFSLDLNGLLRMEDSCAVSYVGSNNNNIVGPLGINHQAISSQPRVTMVDCNAWEAKSHTWSLTPFKGDTTFVHIKHAKSGLCVDMADRKAEQDIYLAPCSDSADTQLWMFERKIHKSPL